MKIKIGIATLAIFVSASSMAFDCNKAKKPIELEICMYPKVKMLDDSLSLAYEMMRASYIGEGASIELKKTQRKFNKDREICLTAPDSFKCLVKMYEERIEKVCSIPVISGVHPNCEE